MRDSPRRTAREGPTNAVDIPVGVRVDTVIPLGDDCFLAPEITAAWIHSAGDNRPGVDTGFVETGTSMTVRGIDPGRNRWQLGAGMKARFNQRVDAQLNYDLEIRKRYRNHNLSLSFGVDF